MLKKRILILSCLIFSVTLISQVNSYSMAKVENTATVSITSSENALIGITENGKIRANKNIEESVTLRLIDSTEEPVIENETVTTTVEDINIDFVITNNMYEDIDISLDLHKSYGIELKYEEVSIKPGECFDDWFKIDENILPGSHDIDIKISANWNNGSAVIYSQINVMVEETRDLVVNTIEDRKIDSNVPKPDSSENSNLNNDNNEQRNNNEMEKEDLSNNVVEYSSPINEETNTIEEKIKESNSVGNAEEINTTAEEINYSPSIIEEIEQSTTSE